MIGYDVRVDPQDLAMIESQLKEFPKKIPTVLSRAINRITGQANTQIRRGIANEINLQSSIIGRYLTVRRATKSQLEARIELSGHRIPAAKFKGRRLAKGASFQIQKGGERKTLLYKKTDPIFWGVMDTGHEGIFTRPQGKRYKIHELLGPSISTAFTGAPELVADAITQSQKNLAARVRHEIKYELEKRKRK